MTTSSATPTAARLPDAALAWYFVLMWGSGYLATKVALRYAAPFTFLTLRFCFGVVCMLILVAWSKPAWPVGARAWIHIVVAGLLMHVGNLGGSHYAQYLGMSAGITALILATQPLLTALLRMNIDRLFARQWIGIAIGLAGVALVVGHKIDVDAASAGSLAAVLIALVAITTGTLHQRRYCAEVDLRSAGLIQFAVSGIVFAPLAFGVEGFVVHWDWRLFAVIVYIVIGASILAVNALHALMRRGIAANVTSMLYLTPVVALFLEWLMFDVVPAPTSIAGIVVTCVGVGLVTWQRRTPVPEVET